MIDRARHGPRRVLTAATAALLVLLLTLALAEGAVRAYSSIALPKMMVLDDRLGWRHGESRSKRFVNELGQSILVIHDQDGLRAASETTKRDERPQLLVLGDSFTEAVHVAYEDTFVALIERKIPGIGTLNAGVGGYGTVQQYLYLESALTRLAPQAVLLAFFDNDLDDNCLSYSPGFGPRPYARLTDAGVVLRRELDPTDFERFILPIPFSATINRYSYFYNFVNNRIYQQLFADRLRQQLKEDTEGTSSCGRLDVLFDIVDRMARLLRERSIPFAIALIPSKQAVLSGDGSHHEPIIAHCAERGLRCHTLLPDLQDAPDPSKLYFEQDIHWTAEGHRAAAEALVPLVNEQMAIAPE